jgi:hypothetical protein
MVTLHMPVLRRDTTDQDISTTEFSWEWDLGLTGATTTDGAAIASAGRAEGAITRTPATIRGARPGADTRRITGRATAGDPVADHPTTVEDPEADHPAMGVVEDRPAMVAEEDHPAMVAAVVGLAEANRRTVAANRQVATDINRSLLVEV